MKINFEEAKKSFIEGLNYFNKERYLDAENKFKESISYFPNRVSTLLNLAATQILLQKHDEALINSKLIIQLEPRNILAIMNISTVYSYQRDFIKALHYIEIAVKIDSKNPDILANKASILRFMGKIENALEIYNEALKFNKDSISIKFNKSICELSLERFQEGWINYEYRETKNFSYTKIKKWPDKTMKILILSEQGVGDVVMFSSLLQFIKDFDNITFLIDRRFEDIYKYSFPKINFVNFDNFISINFKDYYQIRIGSLSQFYIQSRNDFKYLINPYLKLPPNEDRLLSGYIDSKKVNIGIYWFSNSKQSGKVTKIHLSQIIKSLNVVDKNFISLQDGGYDDEIISVEKMLNVRIKRINNFDLKNDINRLARLISKCNLIISISTTVVHLAGALGIPTIVLCQYSPDWRFFQFKEKFPWYPNTYILKQESLDDWSVPLQKLNFKVNEIISKVN